MVLLSVFLLLEFIHLAHDGHNLLTQCNGMHVYTKKTSVYTFIWRSCKEWESELKLTPRENPLNWMALRRIQPVMLHHTGQQAQHTTN